MTTLLVAKNKESVELLKFISGLIDDGSDIYRKLRAVVKEKTEHPVLRLPDGRVITDINQIYFYFGQAIQKPVRRQQESEDYGNFDDYLDSEMDYDSDGKVRTRDDYDSEPQVRKRRGDEESSEEEREINKDEIAERFMARRGNPPPKMNRGRVIEPTSDVRKGSKQKQKRKQKKYESSEESESGEGSDVEEYMSRVMRERE